MTRLNLEPELFEYEEGNGSSSCQCKYRSAQEAARSVELEEEALLTESNLESAEENESARGTRRPAPKQIKPSAPVCTLRQPEVIDRFKFKSHTELESSQPVNKAHPVVQQVVACVKGQRGTRDAIRVIELIGHTDPVGSDSSNYLLGCRRALTVKKALVAALGSEARGLTITVLSQGESQPIWGKDTETRRVQIFTYKSAPARRSCEGSPPRPIPIPTTTPTPQCQNSGVWDKPNNEVTCTGGSRILLTYEVGENCKTVHLILIKVFANGRYVKSIPSYTNPRRAGCGATDTVPIEVQTPAPVQWTIKTSLSTEDNQPPGPIKWRLEQL